MLRDLDDSQFLQLLASPAGAGRPYQLMLTDWVLDQNLAELAKSAKYGVYGVYDVYGVHGVYGVYGVYGCLFVCLFVCLSVCALQTHQTDQTDQSVPIGHLCRKVSWQYAQNVHD